MVLWRCRGLPNIIIRLMGKSRSPSMWQTPIKVLWGSKDVRTRENRGGTWLNSENSG